MLYSLLDNDGKVELNIGLTSYLTDFNNHHKPSLEIELPSGFVVLKKSEYLNKGKVYDNSKVFFIVATKSLCQKQAKRLLLQHACNKIDTRLAHLQSLKSNYKKLLAA